MTKKVDHLVAGDEVAVFIGFGRRRVSSIRKIARTTATQIITESGGRFRKEDGYEVGGGWNRSQIEPATDELRAQCRREFLVSEVRLLAGRDLSHVTTESLEEVYRLLERTTSDA